MNKFQKVINKLKESKNTYVKSWYELPINETAVLLEAGQGKNTNGNMFALLKELELNEKWNAFTPYFVATKETEEVARKKFVDYGFNKVKLVFRNSKEYHKLLATCKYLITDNSFPPFFCKRRNQIYLNTWHGTPLKFLGKSDLDNAVSLGNIQKNYFSCDYALFPNQFTKNVFMKDYMLENLYSGKVILADYPRNSILLDCEHAKILKKKIDLEDKEVIAYMPTWRGTGRYADSSGQTKDVLKHLNEIDQKLNSNQVLYVNLHFLVANNIKYENFNNIRPFPSDYETYEFLSLCDILITDYSSVFFDFAVTGKKIILFTYDEEIYLKEKGTYINIDELPFQRVRNIDSLVEAINQNSPHNDIEKFQRTYCNYADSEIPRKLLALLIEDDASGLVIEEAPKNEKGNHIVHVGALDDEEKREDVARKLREFNTESQNIILTFIGGVNQKNISFLKNLSENIAYVSIVNGFAKRVKGKDFFIRENKRLFPNWIVEDVSILKMGKQEYREILNCFGYKKVLTQNPCWTGKQHYNYSNGQLSISFKVKSLPGIVELRKDLKAYANGQIYKISWDNNLCQIVLPVDDLLKSDAKTLIYLVLENDNDFVRIPIKHKGRIKRYLALLSEKVFYLPNSGLSCYFLENNGTLTITIRKRNVTDSRLERYKIALAFFLSKCMPYNRPIILFEKNSEKYEESSSVVYEKLIDLGYQNVFFFLDRKSPYKDNIKSKYTGHIIWKYTFKHYLMFFRAKTFIASEMIGHAMETRPLSKFIRFWLRNGKYNYIFLQHGIMYMVSLDAQKRGFFGKFIKRKGTGINRVVVSSKLEADHFIQLGGFPRESLYLCGLPKFDKSVLSDNADRIMIMITWRPWEQVQGLLDFQKTKYYKMIKRIIAVIPDQYKDKLMVLPHPLIAEQMKGCVGELSQYVPENLNYDELLQKTKLLITDYSSISFDSFYRGSNVIFYWEEKDECMEFYGNNAKLMLTEELAFGKICYNVKQLSKAIHEGYNNQQKKSLREKYLQLVEFHDEKNTERLINLMKKDGVI